SLYFHHMPGWIDGPDRAADPFPLIKDHVMRHRATRVEAIDDAMAAALTPAAIDDIVAMIPESWLAEETGAEPARVRAAYSRYLKQRLQAPRRFVEEAVRVR
ncbi:MAG TPA: hypothetical protein VKD69_18090, partial [Vicinamibacterales bacterium]|nr:hypothetical protein [Vicinamibacterales bacterium]